jgi:hypothetical protein
MDIDDLPPQLFWVWTDDHGRDWFVVARMAAEAIEHHQRTHGYAEHVLDARHVMSLGRGARVPVGYASEEVLRAYGARFLRSEFPRQIEIAGQRFLEGMRNAEPILHGRRGLRLVR